MTDRNQNPTTNAALVAGIIARLGRRVATRTPRRIPAPPCAPLGPSRRGVSSWHKGKPRAEDQTWLGAHIRWSLCWLELAQHLRAAAQLLRRAAAQHGGDLRAL